MMERGTIFKVVEYYLKDNKFVEEMNRAKGEFFDFVDGSAISDIEDSIMPFFNEWLVFDFKLKNKKGLIENFYHQNPFNLPNEKLQVYKDLSKNEYGLFEVLKVDKGEGLEIKNVMSKKKYYVYEKIGTYQLFPGVFIFGRVSKLNGKYELVGSDSMMIHPSFKKELKKFIPKKFIKISPKDVYSLALGN